MPGRTTHECSPVAPGLWEPGGRSKGMSASRGVSIKGIYLTDIGSDWIKPGRTRDHFGSHPLFSLDAPDFGTPPKEAWVVVGGGTEYVPLLVQTDSPSVIVDTGEETPSSNHPV